MCLFRLLSLNKDCSEIFQGNSVTQTQETYNGVSTGMPCRVSVEMKSLFAAYALVMYVSGTHLSGV